nr:PIN domain-containing protein [Halorhodospira halophila]
MDTNILIYLIKNRPPAVAERVNALPREDLLCMSFVTFAEQLKGAERSTRKAQVLQSLERLKQEIIVVYPDSPVICHHYAEQFTLLNKCPPHSATQFPSGNESSVKAGFLG